MTDDRKLQELGSRLVEREVYYCVSTLISNLAQLSAECNSPDLDQDELINICVRDDWETPGQWFIQNDADLDDLEKIANNNNGYWSDVLEECGVPTTVQLETHSLCAECHLVIQIPDIDPTQDPHRLAEIEACVKELPANFEYRGQEYDEEFSASRCDCCGTYLAGARYSYTDFTDESDDLSDRINTTPDRHETEKLIRSNVEALVTDDDAWREVCEDNHIDPEQREAYEHWIVSDWLARKLEEKSEMTGEIMGLTIWGRTCSGQSISMDWVIQQIAAELWPEELK